MIRSGTIFGPHQTTVYAGPGSNRYSRSPIESDTVRRMRASPAEYLRLDLRAHDLLREVPLYDVSIVDLPGGGAGRSVADIRALESAAAPSRVANTIYGLRHFLGRVFGWDRMQMPPEDSLLSRLSERDRRDSEITPGTPVGSFLVLYQFPGEALSETRNATVHGYVCTALARTASGYRLYWGIYVIPVSWLTRPYLIAIEPFRRILYPAMLRRIRRAWRAAYGTTA
jgi:hypothetical protein